MPTLQQELLDITEGELRTYNFYGRTYYLYYYFDDSIFDEEYGYGYRGLLYDQDPASHQPIREFDVFSGAIIGDPDYFDLDLDLVDISTPGIAQLAEVTIPQYKSNIRWPFFRGYIQEDCLIYKILYKTANVKAFPIKWEDGVMTGLDVFLKALKTEPGRFIIGSVSLFEESQEMGHTDVLVVDQTKKEIERFDPRGWREDFNLQEFDRIVKEQVTSLGYNYITGSQYCPMDLFSMTDEESQVFGRINGYCTIWSFFWVDMRLRYPDVERNSLIATIIDKVPKPIVNFIVEYSNTLTATSYKYLFEAGVYKYSVYFDPEQDDLEDIINLFPVTQENGQLIPIQFVIDNGVYIYSYRQMHYFPDQKYIYPKSIKYIPEQVLDLYCRNLNN